MFDFDTITALPAWYERLRESGLPVLIYGMGTGCEKLLRAFGRLGIRCEGIFASDDFVRGREFCGFPVTTLTEAEERFGDLAVAVGFGTSLPEVMERIDSISRRHLLVYPDTAVAGEEFFEKERLAGLSRECREVWSLLADERSKQTFEAVLRFKVTGNIEELKKVFCSPDELYGLLDLGEREIYFDVGAYTGDTVEELLSRTGGRYERIYALEPSKRNFQKLLRRCGGLDNISLYNAAADEKDGVVRFTDGAGRQQSVTEGSGRPCAARSLDSILRSVGCTYIKYDVEGADRPALLGSRRMIEAYSPKIRTGVYHRPYDIIELPLLLHRLQPAYRLYLRQQPYYPAWDTELIAKL
ncbi:MAG: FkbM family methyltransferase [Ruminococcus sp.]|nr:FkbM family methyltransferase [Ruminococcus sp.]